MFCYLSRISCIKIIVLQYRYDIHDWHIHHDARVTLISHLFFKRIENKRFKLLGHHDRYKTLTMVNFESYFILSSHGQYLKMYK